MRGVRKIYRSGIVETEAMAGLTLAVNRGEFVAIMGPSGSGKTTFLSVAGLLDDFQQGEYRLDGENVAGIPDRRLSRLRNQKIGFIFQSFNLIPDLDVFDNVDVPLRYRGLPAGERARRIESVLALLGLTARSRQIPSQLSGGQQQRVAIARALVGQPELLLADEPTGNLDSASARQIMDLLARINAEHGMTIIMVTHDQELAAPARRPHHRPDPSAGGRLARQSRPPLVRFPDTCPPVRPRTADFRTPPAPRPRENQRLFTDLARTHPLARPPAPGTPAALSRLAARAVRHETRHGHPDHPDHPDRVLR
jgi:putative ABC transport system ATP-binding protein